MPKLNDNQVLLASMVVEDAFKEDTVGIISHLNNIGKLDDFLKSTGLKSSVSRMIDNNLTPTKKVLVVGQGVTGELYYRQQCVGLGISPDNFEFYLDYKDGAKIDFDKYKDNPEYGGIIVGPMDHSGISKGGFSSIIERIESEPGFPMVVRGNKGGELKLSLNDFSSAVMELFRAGALMV